MSNPPEQATRLIPIVELTYRSYEMDQCQITDSGGNEEQQSTYRHLYDIYVGSIDYRFASFIERHGMQNSFIVDDAKETKAVPAAPAKDRDLTVAQCRADVAAWKSASQSNLPDYAVSLLPIEEVALRATEMLKCSAADTDSSAYRAEYEAMHTLYLAEMAWRFKEFIEKSGAMDTLIKEDAAEAGAREQPSVSSCFKAPCGPIVKLVRMYFDADMKNVIMESDTTIYELACDPQQPTCLTPSTDKEYEYIDEAKTKAKLWALEDIAGSYRHGETVGLVATDNTSAGVYILWKAQQKETPQ